MEESAKRGEELRGVGVKESWKERRRVGEREKERVEHCLMYVKNENIGKQKKAEESWGEWKIAGEKRE